MSGKNLTFELLQLARSTAKPISSGYASLHVFGGAYHLAEQNFPPLRYYSRFIQKNCKIKIEQQVPYFLNDIMHEQFVSDYKSWKKPQIFKEGKFNYLHRHDLRADLMNSYILFFPDNSPTVIVNITKKYRVPLNSKTGRKLIKFNDSLQPTA